MRFIEDQQRIIAYQAGMHGPRPFPNLISTKQKSRPNLVHRRKTHGGLIGFIRPGVVPKHAATHFAHLKRQLAAKEFHPVCNFLNSATSCIAQSIRDLLCVVERFIHNNAAVHDEERAQRRPPLKCAPPGLKCKMKNSHINRRCLTRTRRHRDCGRPTLSDNPLQ